MTVCLFVCLFVYICKIIYFYLAVFFFVGIVVRSALYSLPVCFI